MALVDEPATRYGPWLPNVAQAPASYRGPLVYGSGRTFGFWWHPTWRR